jgi:hypothetical protein
VYQSYGIKGCIKVKKHPVVLFALHIFGGHALKSHDHMVDGAAMIKKNNQEYAGPDHNLF